VHLTLGTAAPEGGVRTLQAVFYALAFFPGLSSTKGAGGQAGWTASPPSPQRRASRSHSLRSGTMLQTVGLSRAKQAIKKQQYLSCVIQ